MNKRLAMIPCAACVSTLIKPQASVDISIYQNSKQVRKVDGMAISRYSFKPLKAY